MYNLENIPPVSVILIFYEEPFSTLLRSIHSILNRTPPNILGEIILVDDGNNDPDVYSNDEKKPSKLQRYVQYLPKTRLIRSSQRQGIQKFVSNQE
jgi:polypeptide N-acetylgalactosaminyltransferase